MMNVGRGKKKGNSESCEIESTIEKDEKKQQNSSKHKLRKERNHEVPIM